jgi:hypothetical protein
MELSKLTTQRLLALLKAKRRLSIREENLDYNSNETRDARQLVQDIKDELVKREHVERKGK